MIDGIVIWDILRTLNKISNDVNQHINFIMQETKDQFYRTAPSRILEKAALYSSKLKHYHELPKAISKSMVVRKQAQFERDDIDYAIKHSKYQLDLYRKKQQQDIKTRNKFENKIKDAAEKVVKNEIQIQKKKDKKAENYNKHLDETYKRFVGEEKRHRQNQKQEAYKLRRELQQFYQKEAQRKKDADHAQVQVGTEYQKAVDRINRIHQKNQEYSLRAEIELDKELKRNNHCDQMLATKRRAVSVLNSDKPRIYDKNWEIFEDNEKRFIQKYGQNEDSSIKAWKKIEASCEKEKKRLGEFFKRRVDKWSELKRRVDRDKAEVPQKCLDILDKTSKSEFRKTSSTFHNSFVEFENIVKKNKSLIKERDERAKDLIMDTHLDLRLKHDSEHKIGEKMLTMKQHARKIADSYL